MLRSRLQAFLAVPRTTSIFRFTKPLIRPQSPLLKLRWPFTRNLIVSPRTIPVKFLSTATPGKPAEIIPPRIVGYWLLGTAGLVFGVVIVGAVTRLTESGLSITEWKPVTGVLPPLSPGGWNQEFEKYKATPEFQVLNSKMSLDDFKEIYMMEYTHRMLGRAVGLVFLIPAAYFIVRRQVSWPFAGKLVGIAGLIGFQGFLGWWMVKSGLDGHDLKVQDGVPRVSQYRLAAHLVTAFGVYSFLMMLGLRILKENKFLKMSAVQRGIWRELLNDPDAKKVRGMTIGMAHMVMATVIVGALVAGLDAGLIYNEFPMMGKGLTPPLKELFNPHYTRTENPSLVSLICHNMGENPATVQLEHRVIATITFLYIAAVWLKVRRTQLPLRIRRPMGVVMAMAVLQVTLGISTLIYMVPKDLAVTHQAGSLMLLTSILVLLGRFRVPKFPV